MSPFDLRGPEFLGFYLCLGAIVLLALYASRRFLEPTDSIKADLSDPYLIAFLRGGKNELLRVGTVCLIHRGLLKAQDKSVSVTSPQAPDSVRTPLERELLAYFRTPQEAASIFSRFGPSACFDYYSHSLETLGLLPNAWVHQNRWIALGLGIVVLWGVALAKIIIALGRGHTNIGFLIMLSIILGVIAGQMMLTRLTLRGKSMLKDLQSLFGGLKYRTSGLTPNDVALIAAVFGFSALPAAVFPYGATLYPKAAAASGQWGGDSSSCGSSGGDGGGGGCGGGGCGGGCGGCGS